VAASALDNIISMALYQYQQRNKTACGGV